MSTKSKVSEKNTEVEEQKKAYLFEEFKKDMDSCCKSIISAYVMSALRLIEELKDKKEKEDSKGLELMKEFKNRKSELNGSELIKAFKDKKEVKNANP